MFSCSSVVRSLEMLSGIPSAASPLVGSLPNSTLYGETLFKKFGKFLLPREHHEMEGDKCCVGFMIIHSMYLYLFNSIVICVVF